MKRFTYTAIFTKEKDGGYSVRVPALSGCFSCGESFVDAVAMIRDALGLYLDVLLVDGKKIPNDRDGRIGLNQKKKKISVLLNNSRSKVNLPIGFRKKHKIYA